MLKNGRKWGKACERDDRQLHKTDKWNAQIHTHTQPIEMYIERRIYFSMGYNFPLTMHIYFPTHKVFPPKIQPFMWKLIIYCKSVVHSSGSSGAGQNLRIYCNFNFLLYALDSNRTKYIYTRVAKVY